MLPRSRASGENVAEPVDRLADATARGRISGACRGVAPRVGACHESVAMEDRRWPTYAPRKIALDTAVASGTTPHQGSMRVRDTEGREYLDAVVGIGCLPLGHGHPKWIAAVEEQMRKLVSSAATFWTEPQQALVDQLVARTPIDDAKVFLGNTGTEVTEAAIKVALRATGRKVIVAFEKAFHGRTLGSIALTANPAYRAPYVSILGEDDDRFARMNVARAPFGELAAVEKLFAEHAGDIAMVVVEPVQGEGGINVASREFLVGLRELCTRHGALLGLDEIQSGTGRTGNFLAWTTIVGDDPSLRPDLAWLAKAIGGGFPIAACIARGDLAAHMTKGSHGSTFGGNPLACAAAVATLRIMDQENALASAAEQLPTLRRIAAEQALPRVREIRGLGAMIGIDVGDADLAGKLVGELQQQGVLVTLSGGTAIRLLLPYHAGETELREVWRALAACLAGA
jgi:acetylornithine/N-succinyldiaminopimelate aminotransferase